MKTQELDIQTATATKWSTITEIAAKLVSPVTNMILARLLTPEAFGIIATITMVISFADIFTDAGFQKFLIQHDFKDSDDLNKSTSVAFWTNIIISLFLWGIIGIFKEKLATLVGNPGLGNVILIAAISLPLTSFSSIQMARFKRNFDFKTLFSVRIISILIPFLVTIPLAIYSKSFWALIIGTIAGNLSNALILTLRSEWKPEFYFDFTRLKKMFSFSWWILLESISVWLTSYIGTFIVGMFLSNYYVGLYKTSMTTVNQITSLITSATSAPLFTALSKLQKKDDDFFDIYFKYIKAISFFVVPLGFGIFIYRDVITKILLGSQWTEAANFVGLWGLCSSICLVLGTYGSAIYNAKGKPFFSFLAQTLHLAALIPVLILTANKGFHTLYISRSIVRLEFVFVQLLLLKVFFKFKISKLLKCVLPSLIGATFMGILSLLFSSITNKLLFQILFILVSIFIYMIFMKVFFKGIIYDSFKTLGFDLEKIKFKITKKVKKNA